MKNYFLKSLILLLLIGTTFFPFTAKAEILDDKFDLKCLQGSKLGYYIGSFDPIHLGHQNVIDQALKSGSVDYVLIYPVPGGDAFKNRSDFAERLKMIASVYQQHPKVLITSWSPKELQDNFSSTIDLEIIGIIGSDVITDTLMGPDKELSEKYRSVFMRGIPLKEKHYQHTIGALMALKADSFLVALRGDVDLSYLENRIYDRPIRAFIPSKTTSSTEVRKAIANRQPFEPFLSYQVQAIIKQEGLYGFPSQFNKALQDELLEMQEQDQKARFSLMSHKEPSKELYENIKKIDVRNGKRLKTIINQYGWPGVSLVGLEGASAFWILVQHQDQDVDFQKECLELLKEAVNQYEASLQSQAYLTDRVKVNEGKPQIYGTQWVQKEGNFCLYPVEDIEHLDKRRLQMGLNTIAEYKKQMQMIYQLSEEPFRID
ncbi:DUF6624 domain-containing protein [Criblamydia sequanensis]|uniref:Secreted protein n=1 Tax=Candidatus Criblamydia sequanensis CRIB-18 TaxID=1437425 RepID=A0A090D320_9BACT|nr:DUF6624 domain-containing protein [Criblamydia sequanensis]CDR34848.1 putative secreted protein [Criblamydia sequanensis CRIB-18]